MSVYKCDKCGKIHRSDEDCEFAKTIKEMIGPPDRPLMPGIVRHTSRADRSEIAGLRERLAAAQRELADLKDLANGLIEFAKEMLPICPEKARKMLVRGIEKGRDMRTNATAEIERLTAERDRYREALEKIVDWAICDRDKHGRAGMAGGYAIARAALAGAGEGE